MTSGTDLPAIRTALLAWYDDEHRDFPWRHTRDPYRVLVSEVMLQQTQASRVAVAFPAFLGRFPTIGHLASATDREVLAAWSGLGYNRRARGLWRAARSIRASGWPRDLPGLEALPGVGPYTARAIASLAFGVPVGVVDTNVRRWLVRRFGLPADASPSRLQQLADLLAAADLNRPEAWTHASMEFGAAVCRARSPACDGCPIGSDCPSRNAPSAVPVPRQPAFEGSLRALRGAALRLLAKAPGHRLPERTLLRRLGTRHASADRRRALLALEADRLIHRVDGELHLGGAAEDGAATIGP